MSEQRKTTGTRKRAPKKDTESKTTRTRKKVAEEQAAPVQQNEEAAPDRVKALQTALIERNYHCGTNGADGTYGRLTAYAVRCFQASKGLIVNGRADRYTIAALGGTWKE